MAYNRNRQNYGGNNRNYGNNMGSVNPWDSGSNLNAGANVLNSLVGNGPDAVQQLLAASKILSNVLAPQNNILPQNNMLNSGGYNNRGGNFDRYNNRQGGGRDNWGGQNNRRNDSGNFRNNRGNQNQRNNKNSSGNIQKKDFKPKKEEPTKDVESSGDKDDGKPKEPNRYADIPKALLYCHVCRKYMWDDVSFDNHIKGRNHKLMLEELDKLYKMQCELMRQEFRMTEQQNGWYFDKGQRMGKKVKKALEYCTMCDLNYHGTPGFHRKSTKHQELKHFLHPKCNICNLEFPTRLEWDEHILIPAHLQKMTAKRNELKPDLKDDDFDFDDFLYVSDLSDYLASDLKAASSILTDVTPLVVEKEEKEEEEKEENADDKEKKEKEEKEKVEKVDESTIVFHADEENATETFIESVRNLTEEEYSKKIFVRYNASIPAGVDFVVQSSGHLCRICNLFVGSRDDALKHCKGYSHHISLVNLLAKVNQARKTARKRTQKDRKDEDDVEMKESGADGEEGNWKRRKLTDDGKDKKMDVDEEEDEEEENNQANGEEENGEHEEEDGLQESKEEVSEVKNQVVEEIKEVEAPSTPSRTGTPRARRGRPASRK